MLRRIVWAALKVPFIILAYPFLMAELVWCPTVWIFTGKDVLLGENTPLGWICRGWRSKAFDWPLADKEK
jgi:hypothetical protein